MKKRELNANGIFIKIDKINDEDYVSLTDIAKKSSDYQPKNLIQNWMKNSNTIRFLFTWERLHNENFKGIHLDAFLAESSDNRIIISPQKWIEKTNAIGLMSKSGRTGGTYAHSEIALNFCYWLSPEFQVYVWKEFKKLKEEEAQRKNFEWHISKITDNVEEIRNLLDTIPGQLPERNRIFGLDDDE